jgi:hypothetical protein
MSKPYKSKQPLDYPNVFTFQAVGCRYLLEIEMYLVEERYLVVKMPGD